MKFILHCEAVSFYFCFECFQSLGNLGCYICLNKRGFLFNAWDVCLKSSKIYWTNFLFQVIASWLNNLLEDCKYKQNCMNLKTSPPNQLMNCFWKTSSTIFFIEHFLKVKHTLKYFKIICFRITALISLKKLFGYTKVVYWDKPVKFSNLKKKTKLIYMWAEIWSIKWLFLVAF